MLLLYTNIDQTLVNTLHGLLNCFTGGLDFHVITTEYRTRVHCIHITHLFCNAFVHVIYSGVSGQCSHTITTWNTTRGPLCEYKVSSMVTGSKPCRHIFVRTNFYMMVRCKPDLEYK